MGTLRRSQARRTHPAAAADRGTSASADKPRLAKPKINGASAAGEHAGDDLPAEALQQNLRAMRARRQMTLEELATSAGLTRGYLSLVERGLKVPSISALLKIASALEVN